jgi:myo-inositol-1(or 4)-monophosphatase
MNVMVEAAQKAGRALVRDFGEIENLQVSRKGPGDFVSNADRKAEKIIHEYLLKARPKYGFLMEETGEVKGEDASYKWIVDPLDGTTNFLHGLPHWSITIALEKDNEIVAGLVYDPLRDEMFTAEKGTGAFMNNTRITVAARKELAETLMAHDTTKLYPLYNELNAEFIQLLTLRRLGSAALDLAYVAAGRMDSVILHKLNPWDLAAGSLLIKEARGNVSDFDGGKTYISTGDIVGGNAALHAEILKRTKPKTTAKAS